MPTTEEMEAERFAQVQQKEYAKAVEQQIKFQQQINAIETIAKQYLDSSAIARYGSLKTAHPEKAIRCAMIIVQAAQSGQLVKKLDDNEFKQVLKNMDAGQKEFRFKFA